MPSEIKKPMGALDSVKQQLKPFQPTDWKPNLKDVREDGSLKGAGYFGTLKRPDGGVSGELSIGVNLGGKEMEIPSMVPTLSKEEFNYLMTTHPDEHHTANPQVWKSIIQKAVEHAKSRMLYGKPVFAQEHEEGSFQQPSF